MDPWLNLTTSLHAYTLTLAAEALEHYLFVIERSQKAANTSIVRKSNNEASSHGLFIIAARRLIATAAGMSIVL